MGCQNRMTVHVLQWSIQPNTPETKLSLFPVKHPKGTEDLHGDVDECNLLLHVIRIIKSRRRLESS